MSAALSIIRRAQSGGLNLSVGEGGTLRYAGDSATFRHLQEELATHKAAIVETLANIANTRQSLETFAAELGFKWHELLGPELIQEDDLEQFARSWNDYTQSEWRAFIASVGQRAKHRCLGLAHRHVCDCRGHCRAFGVRS